ncbi:hypothetical protein CONPUDRAFT_68736 [Coniophora puteana RWD-64-598 SS2]|uniref:DUF6534 domain-containing protein n=1 Tax=Coniophora puteana (strain RWD-64-598) TaxID=741705 RepID=A0A5M3N5J9_CONPW|nr:uncharacterized protein CONPUDRAFT_68736 [Coniophora puteana RWD-64-598 SS2]EIW86135.1 hypothetical protein CONPUDRAFT_68736 [Coniophora puteana RWD-64-598 SS2]
MGELIGPSSTRIYSGLFRASLADVCRQVNNFHDYSSSTSQSKPSPQRSMMGNTSRHVRSSVVRNEHQLTDVNLACSISHGLMCMITPNLRQTTPVLTGCSGSLALPTHPSHDGVRCSPNGIVFVMAASPIISLTVERVGVERKQDTVRTSCSACSRFIWNGCCIWYCRNDIPLYGLSTIVNIPSESLVHRLISLWLVLQVVTDFVIAISLAVILFRSRTSYKKTNHVINQLIRGAIQTGVLAGIFSLGHLVSFVRWPSTELYGMFAMPLGRVYTNAILDTLLSREDLRNMLAESDAIRIESNIVPERFLGHDCG